ncbi:MAG: C4-type zinc ribbon domain-containing protein [Eubacteriales bacterium]|nr:C4-type zinc ribbon domain-containing protein [Eubacteriales bacterium]
MSKIDALLQYQEADTKKQQLEKAVRSTENRQKLNKLYKLLKEQQAAIAKASEDTELAVAALTRLNSQSDALSRRFELESGELDILKQDEEATAEEMAELRKDIEKINRESANLEKEIKQLLANMTKILEDYQKTRQIAGKAKKEYDALRLVCDEEKKASAEVIDDCTKQMTNLEAGVDAVLMQKYRRAREHYPLPVVPIVNSKCSGCNMSLPILMLKKLANPDVVAECENCGRLLYSK